MATLMVPAAGLSTRYGLNRPKFLLQHPTLGTMLEASISGLESLGSSPISQIRIVSLQEYFADLDVERLRVDLESRYEVPVTFTLLNQPTSSMVESICRGIEEMEFDEELVVKDCDNLVGVDFQALFSSDNSISFADLRKFPKIVAHNKSYIDFDANSQVQSMVEKQIQGPYINVGCVKFKSASDFLAAAKALNNARETYVSDIVSKMVEQGQLFKAVEVSAYEDWGTLDEWLNYISTFATLFVDIDGTLVENANPLGIANNWSSFIPITSNLDFLLKLQNKGRTKIIFTTSRSERHRDYVVSSLSAYGFSDPQLVMGLPHAKRILVNDFARTNPFPSAIAVNLPRNSGSLSDYLDRL
jgi:hypothetical protein